MHNITVAEVKNRMNNGEELFLLDVREPHEYRIANLNGYLIPLHVLPLRYKELDPSREIIVHCHHGLRSMHAVQFLLKAGFPKVRNLTGGIDAWSRQIDPTIRRY